METGAPTIAEVEELRKLTPGEAPDRLTVSSTALLLLVSRYDTFPVGSVVPAPPTVAVRVYVPAVALAVAPISVIVGKRPPVYVTVSDEALELLVVYVVVPTKTAL